MSSKRGARELAPVESMSTEIAGQTPQPIAAVEARANQFLADAQAVIGGEVSKAQLWADVEMFEHAVSMGVLGSGIRLVLLKRMSEHGEFTRELERIGLQPRIAQMRMAATVKLLGPDLSKVHRMRLADIGIRKLMELATLDDEQIDSLVEGNEVLQITVDKLQTMSHRELREKLRKTEQKLEDARAAQAEQDAHTNELKRENGRLRREWSKREMDDRIAERRANVSEVVAGIEAQLGDFAADAPQHGLAGAVHALLNDAAEIEGGAQAQAPHVAAAIAQLELALRALRDSLPIELPQG